MSQLIHRPSNIYNDVAPNVLLNHQKPQAIRLSKIFSFKIVVVFNITLINFFFFFFLKNNLNQLIKCELHQFINTCLNYLLYEVRLFNTYIHTQLS